MGGAWHLIFGQLRGAFQDIMSDEWAIQKKEREATNRWISGLEVTISNREVEITRLAEQLDEFTL